MINQLYNKQMKNLRSALSKEETSQLGKNSFPDSALLLKNNNSESMWSIGGGSDDQDDKKSQDTHIFSSEVIQTLNRKIKDDSDIDQVTLSELVCSYEKMYGKNNRERQNLEQINRIIKQLLIKSPSQLEGHLVKLSELLKGRIKRNRQKQQKKSLDFDQIAEKIFKKPTEHKRLKQNKKKVLEINLKSQFQTRVNRKSNKNHDSNGNSNGTKNSGSGSQDSGDAKLGKLLNSGSYEHQVVKNNKRENQQYVEEGYSFSAVMQGSVAVKQRVQVKKDKNNIKSGLKNEDKHKQDQAFLFYRPKQSNRR